MNWTPVRVEWMCLALGLAAAPAAAQPRFDMRIVAIDGVVQPSPRTTVSIVPDRELTIDIFGSNWSPLGQSLRSFEFRVDGATLIAGDDSGAFRGQLLIKQGQRPCSQTACTNLGLPSNCQCQDLPFASSCTAGFCTNTGSGTDAPWAAGLFIDPTRENFAFAGFFGNLILLPTEIEPAKPADNPKFSSLLNIDGGPVFSAPEKYFGTIILVASDDTATEESVCGSFAVQAVPSPGSIMVVTGDNPVLSPNTNTITANGPTLDNCPCTKIDSATPANCTVDARQDKDPATGALLPRPQSVSFAFNCLDTSDITTGNFQVRHEPFVFPLPSISNVVPDGQNLTVNLNAPMRLKDAWTCFTFEGPGVVQERCFGVLPGDADSGARSLEPDITRVRDCVQGVAPAAQCQLFSCDPDRSGACRMGDIPRIIDTLNGGDFLNAWFDQFIGGANQVTCPSATSQ